MMRILVIGEFSGCLAQAASVAIERGVKVDRAESLEQSKNLLCEEGGHGLILCEVNLNIKKLIYIMRQERIHTPVLACGPENPDLAAKAISEGAQDYLPLPPDVDLIVRFLYGVTGESKALIGRDPLTNALLKKMARIAKSDASVLISGESGTGKEVIAQYIHRMSDRCDGPFVALNCAALPENLVESELFGHERGAFSGALSRRRGKFEAAHGGTLLLDEISEMDVRLQAKLLRAIQEKEIDRLGGGSPVPVDVRIIATSNRDLPHEVAAGRFRQDLYFRLNVVSEKIPPLRRRPLDILPLAEYFSRYYCEVNGFLEKKITDEARSRLLQMEWRGNVRELENAIHRAVLFSSGETIEASSFDSLEESNSSSNCVLGRLNPWVGHKMDEVEQALILDTLLHTDGNRTHAASLLGISIRALRNKLRDYAEKGANVPPPGFGIAPP